MGYEDVRKRQSTQNVRRGGPSGPPVGRFVGVSVVIGVEPGGRNAARDMAIFPESKQMPGAGGVEGLRNEGGDRIHLPVGTLNV